MNSFSSIPFKKNFGFSLLCKLNANISKLNLKKFNLIKHKFTTTENTTEFSNKDKKKRINNAEMQRMLNSLYRFQESKTNFKENNTETNNTNKNSKKEEKVGILKKSVYKFIDIWKRTFPSEINYETEMKLKQKEAEAIKSQIVYAKDDEIENFKSKVSEWKQEAVILLESITNEEKKNIFGKYTKLMNEKIVKSEAYSKLKETNTFKEYIQFKEDLQVIKTNIQDNISVSYNPAVIAMKDLAVSIF